MKSIRVPVILRIYVIAIGTMILALALVFLVVDHIVEASVYQEIRERVDVAHNTLMNLMDDQGLPSLREGHMNLGSHAIHDNAIVDHEKRIAGGDATIFQIINGKPIRLETTICSKDGHRITGTELQGPARVAFDEGLDFEGISPIAGSDYINRYDLMRDNVGHIIGISYTGIPLTTLHEAISKILIAVALTIVTALSICIILLTAVTTPLAFVLKHIVIVARSLSHGDVNQKTGKISNDEIGDIHAAFCDMIEYQQRIAGIASAIADGHLDVEVTPASQNDRLGVAIAKMTENLRTTVTELALLAKTDSLTRIGNMRAFQETIQSEMSRALRTKRPISLAMIDIDNFKQVNDSNGHQHGDLVLASLATMLGTLRTCDSTFRLGGDEFAVIMPDTSAIESQAAMERIRTAAETKLYGATLSIGTATMTAGYGDAETLRRQADTALYASKRRGRNSVTGFREVADSPLISFR